ncbi:MAG TPA: CHAT domain-containing tetratricopeptide repeat protein, partial [Thermomicrobiales bacterium]|nr:CHAT domain-containing tetratricopeptide repeat protein [Thermomicrobiales bacterium]
EALAAIGPAHDVLVRRGEALRAAQMDQNTAAVCYWLGRYDEAFRLYDRAQRAFESAGAAAEDRAARAKGNKAMVLTLLGDFAAALALYGEVREVFARHGETLEVHRTDQYIADVHVSQGDYTRALRLYGDVFAALERDGQDADAAWVALNMVECYLRLNRNPEALDLAGEVAARFERSGSPTETAKARFFCGLAHARLGEYERALDLLGKAAVVFADTDLSGFVGIAALERATLYLVAEDWAAALVEADRARALFAERGLPVRQAQADLVRARALLGLDDVASATRVARAALATTRERELRWLEHEGHHVLARAALARGDLAGALAACEEAIVSIERAQSRLAVELRGNFLADKLEVYHDAIDCALRLDRPALAFAYLERGKSRALVDYLAGNPDVRVRARDAGDRDLLAELARLREEHNGLYERLYGYGLARRPEPGRVPDGAAPEESDATLRAAIRGREQRIARLLERLALRQAAGMDGLAARTVDARDVQATLDDDAALLEYYFHEGGGAVFVVTGRGLTVVPLATTPRALRQMLGRWQLNLDAAARLLARRQPLDRLADNARGVLGALYEALVRPAEGHLRGVARLVVVPHGPTHAVPFHALHDGERYLAETVEVATCPSSSLRRACAARPRRATGSALVVAFSDGGRLPAVLEEARAVAALFPGEHYAEAAATRAALATAAPRHGIVHLAAHGEARLDNPTFAHLRLADGQLSPADIFNLDLDGALVTLSACETGRAVVQGGDELIGLGRGFLYAGATTLLQSLWQVDDDSTARLMAHAYGRLRDGWRAGAALRDAQLTLLDERGPHPYRWAPFHLVGHDGAF